MLVNQSHILRVSAVRGAAKTLRSDAALLYLDAREISGRPTHPRRLEVRRLEREAAERDAQADELDAVADYMEANP